MFPEFDFQITKQSTKPQSLYNKKYCYTMDSLKYKFFHKTLNLYSLVYLMQLLKKKTSHFMSQDLLRLEAEI